MARRSTARSLTRLERLEGAVRPGDRCPACGTLPHPIRFIIIGCCDSDGTWPLTEPSEPPCSVCGRFRTIQMLHEIRPEGLPWPDREADEEGVDDEQAA